MFKIKTNIPQQDFKSLANITDFNCVSIYCPVDTDSDALKLKFKDQIKNIEQRLIAKGLDFKRAQDILNPLDQMLNDSSIWEKIDLEENKTLVVFLNQGNVNIYYLPNQVDDCVFITSNFYLLPLFEKATSSQLTEDSLKIKQVVLDEELTTNRLEKVIPLAFEGKIATLYVSSKNGVYGVYDDVNKTTMIDSKKSNNNMSLINLAAITTYQYGGQVCLVDPLSMPTKGVSIQAILKHK
ncbi:hypothetical protein ACXGQW_11150 [Wenyingzhuangia sp. IMCC45533]